MQLQSFLSQHLQAMTDLLEEIVAIESPTTYKDGVDKVGAVIAGQLYKLGAEITIDSQSLCGNHICAVLNRGGGNPITLVLHMDTVHPIGSIKRRPVRIEEGRFYGPGVYDMKASLVISLFALKGLLAVKSGYSREIRVLLTSDEEVGSLTSRVLIEQTVSGSVLAMIMEPALPDGSLKSSRKGVGDFMVTAHGRASHAGGEHEKGINAIEELSHQVLRLQALTNYKRGITLSVGDFKGGGVSNVVPDYATLVVDVRAMTMQDSDWITSEIRKLRPVLVGASLQIEGEFNRPPMECNNDRLRIIERIRTIGASIGVDVKHGPSGGGSDASFTSAVGVPTMDGFGAVGDGAHAVHEHIILSSLVERSVLCAAVLASY